MAASWVLTGNRIVTTAIVGPVVISFIAWAVPGELNYVTRGFAERSDLTAATIVFILCWYFLCVVAVTAGILIVRAILASPRWSSVGSRPGVRHDPHASCDFTGSSSDRRILWWLLGIALVGLVYSYVTILSSGILLPALRGQQGNELFAQLPGGSSLATLRYAIIPAAAVALHLRAEGHVGWPTVALAMIGLLAQAALSNRLSLFACIICFIYLRLEPRIAARGRPRRLLLFLVAGAAVAVVLTWLNYLRNAPFYRSAGIDNPILMNIYQILTYLGAPAQAQVGATNGYLTGRLDIDLTDPMDRLTILTPTFFRSADKSAGITYEHFDGTVDLAAYLNTNSVLADGLASIGLAGLLLAGLGLVFAGCLYAWFDSKSSVARVGAGLLLYCFAEMWRLYMLNTGLVIAALGSVVVASWLVEARVRRGVQGRVE